MLFSESMDLKLQNARIRTQLDTEDLRWSYSRWTRYFLISQSISATFAHLIESS